MYRSRDEAIFLALLALGASLLFMTTTATNLAIMHAVERRHRPFALALASLGAHALGDVPSPIAIGWVRRAGRHAMLRSSLSLARGGP